MAAQSPRTGRATGHTVGTLSAIQELMRNVIYSMTVLLVCLSSCRKDEPDFEADVCVDNCYVIDGHVQLQPENTGQEGIILELKHYVGFPTQENILATTTTDANGNYRFTIEGNYFTESNQQISISGTKDGFLLQDPMTYHMVDSLMLDVSVQDSLVCFRSTDLDLHVRATQITDFTYFNVSHDYGWTRYGNHFNQGASVDTVFHLKTAAGMPTVIEWDTTGGSTQVDELDTIVAPAGVTTTYEIEI